jgi:hypothetical protein
LSFEVCNNNAPFGNFDPIVSSANVKAPDFVSYYIAKDAVGTTEALRNNLGSLADATIEPRPRPDLLQTGLMVRRAS